MIPITALLNGLDDDQSSACPASASVHTNAHASAHAKDKPTTPLLSAFKRDSMSMTASPCSPSGPEDAVTQGHREPFSIQAPTPTSSVVAGPDLASTPLSESASLMGALTLQALRYSSSPVLASPSSRSILTPDTGLPSTASPRRRAGRKTSPRRSRGSPMAASSLVTDEDRRAKQRMIVKRCYYKKINTINDLRQQVEQLEHAFQVMLEYERKRPLAVVDDQDQGPRASRLRVRRQWIEVLSEKESLRHENQRLRKLADEHYMKNQSRVRTLLDANRKDIHLFTPAFQH